MEKEILELRLKEEWALVRWAHWRKVPQDPAHSRGRKIDNGHSKQIRVPGTQSRI